MNFLDAVSRLADRASLADAQLVIRRERPGRGEAVQWVSAEAGIAMRTARRWLSDDAPAARVGTIVGLALTLARLALIGQVMSHFSGVDVGTVEVEYDGEPQGTRNIGHREIDLAPIADALMSGAVEFAEEAMSRAVLEAYEPGLEDVLDISDYCDGITFY